MICVNKSEAKIHVDSFDIGQSIDITLSTDYRLSKVWFNSEKKTRKLIIFNFTSFNNYRNQLHGNLDPSHLMSFSENNLSSPFNNYDNNGDKKRPSWRFPYQAFDHYYKKAINVELTYTRTTFKVNLFSIIFGFHIGKSNYKFVEWKFTITMLLKILLRGSH